MRPSLPVRQRSAAREAPVVQMLEDQHPEHDVGGCSQTAPAPTLGMALGQRRRDAIDEDLVVKERVDASVSRVWR
jgi:hypothetical protein